MSKYGKYIIGVLIGIVLIVLVWQIVFGRDEKKEMEVSFPEEIIEKVNLSASFDKEKYKSKDTAKIDIIINSNKDSRGLMIEVEGMRSRFGDYYFQEKKNVDLQKNSDSKILVEKELPLCSTCSGFPAGSYEVVVSIARDNYELDRTVLDLNLKP